MLKSSHCTSPSPGTLRSFQSMCGLLEGRLTTAREFAVYADAARPQ